MTIREKIERLRSSLQLGIVPAMATPTHPDGYLVNQPAIRDLVSFLIDKGVKGLFIGGTTGEGILFPVEQRKRLHAKSVRSARGRVPVLLHVGANTLADCLELSKHAESVGADAIVAVTPYFYPLQDDTLFDYYQAISQAAPDTPLLAYDIPQMAINGISPDLLHKLTREIPSFAGLKSSRPDAQIIRKLVDVSREHTMVLAGNERIALSFLALGADGLISGLSTAIPEPFVAMTQAFEKGNIIEALHLQRTINLLLDAIPAGSRIGAIKQLLEERLIEVGPPVPPRPRPPGEWPGWSRMKSIMDGTGIA